MYLLRVKMQGDYGVSTVTGVPDFHGQQHSSFISQWHLNCAMHTNVSNEKSVITWIMFSDPHLQRFACSCSKYLVTVRFCTLKAILTKVQLSKKCLTQFTVPQASHKNINKILPRLQGNG